MRKESVNKIQPRQLIDKIYNYLFDKKAAYASWNKGQQALFTISLIDEEIPNGGFVDFFLKNKQKYVDSGLDGLELINDTVSYAIYSQAAGLYKTHEALFLRAGEDNDIGHSTTVERLESLSREYNSKDKEREELLYQYIIAHPDEFFDF